MFSQFYEDAGHFIDFDMFPSIYADPIQTIKQRMSKPQQFSQSPSSLYSVPPTPPFMQTTFSHNQIQIGPDLLSLHSSLDHCDNHSHSHSHQPKTPTSPVNTRPYSLQRKRSSVSSVELDAFTSHASLSSLPSGELVFSCPHPDCGKWFNKMHNLKSHCKIHISARPFQCAFCKHSFRRNHDLQRHMRLHTGQKPFSCTDCKKMFARSDALRRHVRLEH